MGGAEEDAERDYGGDGGDERGVFWPGEDDEQAAEEEGVGEDEQDDIELVEAETDAIGEGVEGADGEEGKGGNGAADGGPALAGGGEGNAPKRGRRGQRGAGRRRGRGSLILPHSAGRMAWATMAKAVRLAKRQRTPTAEGEAR